MTQSKGIDWQHVSFVVGTRSDLAPDSLPQPSLPAPAGTARVIPYDYNT